MQGWTHVTTAPDQTVGEMMREMLEDNGVVSIIEPEDAISFLGVSANPCRILVPDEQADVARQLIEEFENADPDWEEEFDEEEGVGEDGEPIDDESGEG